jgi:membrane-associated phospholipid phosphatase
LAARRERRLALCCAVGFVLLALAASLGWLRPLDRAIARPAIAASPCALRQVSDVASILFAGEPSLLGAGIGAGFLAWRRRPALAAWLLGLLLATVAVEVGCKHLLDQPSPGAFVATLARRPCAPSPSPGLSGAARSAQAALPSASAGRAAYLELGTLPSGYAARAAFFGLIVAAAAGTRRPRLAATLRWSALALAAALAATRVVIAWHWPSDVAAGLLLGGAAGCLFAALAGDPGGHPARGRQGAGRGGGA